MPPANATLSAQRQPPAVPRQTPRREPDEALDPATIAELPARQIPHMTGQELHRVIRAARTPAALARVDYLDRGTKERLAHLARLSCRNRKS